MVPIALLSLLGLGLAGAWGGLFVPSMGGYGYSGYKGWEKPPSFFYFGGAHIYRDPSVRGLSTRASGAGGK